MEKKKKKLKLNKRRIIVLAVLALIIGLIIFGIGKMFYNLLSPEKVVGNYANMGLAIEDDGVIYYNKYEKGIFKIEKGEEKQLTDHTAYSMTAIDDKIYYLTVSDNNTIDLNYVKKTGEEVTKVKTLYTSISKFYIKDNYVYYVSNKNNIGLYKTSLENGQESTVTLANIQDFVLEDNKIYFTDNVGYLHLINIDGTNKKTVSMDYNIKNIQILKKWIYFYDADENALCKMKKDGSRKTTVATFVNNENYNVTSKNIYYFDTVNKKICKSDLKGKKSKEVISIDANRTRINIVDGVIYYLDNSKDNSQIYQMYRVKQNGKATKSIEY